MEWRNHGACANAEQRAHRAKTTNIHIYVIRMKKTREYGVNDLPGHCKKKSGGSAYSTWLAMLARCYSGRYKAYEGCTVCEDWLLFSNFKRFYDEFWRDGFELDKDILIPGNKVYSPSTCIYVPRKINGFVISNSSRMGEYPTGVYYNKRDKAFIATIMDGRKSRYIGSFDNPMSAHMAWHARKVEQTIALKKECDEVSPILFERLMVKVMSMRIAE